MIEETMFEGFEKCLRLSNGQMEVIVSTQFGPRALFCGLNGGQNLFGVHPDLGEETVNGYFRLYGGHRLWAAPEGNPRSMSIENDPVEVKRFSELSAGFRPRPDTPAGIQKEIHFTIDDSAARVTVYHELTNLNLWPVEIAPWALSIMAPGGLCVIPQEPFVPHGEALLPARTMVLWPYTDLSDPRYRMSGKYLQLRCDMVSENATKIGLLNKQGWAAYFTEEALFIKRFEYDEEAQYPDYGCNCEFFTRMDFLEIESVGPLHLVQPGEKTCLLESWHVFPQSQIKPAETPDDVTLDGVLDGPLRIAGVKH